MYYLPLLASVLPNASNKMPTYTVYESLVYGSGFPLTVVMFLMLDDKLTMNTNVIYLH